MNVKGARRALRSNGLSIILTALFLFAMGGQVWSGWLVHNEDQVEHGEEETTLVEYLGSGHFGEATFENWESEFLQMALYVVLTAYLFQRGSAESKSPDGPPEEVDEDPRQARDRPGAPWPVRRGGLCLLLYEHSLGITFTLLFLLSMALHARTGLIEYNAERVAHGEPAVGLAAFAASSQFWFESFQNWQSEFLSLAAMVVLTIFLRERGSPESKPVAAPTWQTGA